MLLRLLTAHGNFIGDAGRVLRRFRHTFPTLTLALADDAFDIDQRWHRTVLRALAFGHATLPPFVHLMMTVQPDWRLPAEYDPQRFMVLDVADSRREDYRYLDAIEAQMKGAGDAALLHDLLRLDATVI